MHKIISHCIVAGKIEEKKALPSRIGRIIKYYIWNLCKAESRLRSSDTPSLSQGLVYCWPDSSACHTYLPLCAAPVEATGDADKKMSEVETESTFQASQTAKQSAWNIRVHGVNYDTLPVVPSVGLLCVPDFKVCVWLAVYAAKWR